MNRSQISLLCSLLLLTFANIEAIQYAGRVVNDESGDPVPGVSVTLLHSTGKTTTDEEGKFSFSAVVPVKQGLFIRGNSNVFHWRSTSQMFDLQSAPNVKRLSVFNMQGEQLCNFERNSKINFVTVRSLPKSLYLIRVITSDNQVFSVKWIYSGNSQSFSLARRSSINLASAKQLAIISELVFEKQGYQTKHVEIDSDSSYSSMLVKLKTNIGDYVFNEDSLYSYKLTITKENIAKLLDFSQLISNGMTVNSVVVQARIEVGGRILDSIGVRFRGDQSLWDCVSNNKRKTNVKYPQYGFGLGDVCAKFSMKFDFNKYVSSQRFDGLKELNFRSMSFDPSKMHEKLGYSLFNDMGVFSPRTAFAKLYINDSLWGLFCVVEEIDGRFTKSRYPNTGNGNLYKEIWPETEMDNGTILTNLRTNNNPGDSPNTNDFIEFRDAVIASSTDSSNFIENLKNVLDISHLVRYTVVDRAIMNFDGICSSYSWPGGHLRHNFFWYHDDESHLFKLIPWDLDKALLYPEPNFWTNNKPVNNNKIPNWNVVNTSYNSFSCSFDPGSFGGSYTVDPIDKDKFLRIFRNTTWNDFHKQGQLFLDSIFTQKKVDQRLDKWRKLIAGAVGEDPTIDSTEWTVMVDSLSHTIPLMRTNMEMMIDTLIVK
jgi:spore coat protein CotH